MEEGHRRRQDQAGVGNTSGWSSVRDDLRQQAICGRETCTRKGGCLGGCLKQAPRFVDRREHVNQLVGREGHRAYEVEISGHGVRIRICRVSAIRWWARSLHVEGYV